MSVSSPRPLGLLYGCRHAAQHVDGATPLIDSLPLISHKDHRVSSAIDNLRQDGLKDGIQVLRLVHQDCAVPAEDTRQGHPPGEIEPATASDSHRDS